MLSPLSLSADPVIIGIWRWRPGDWRGLNNKSECCQYQDSVHELRVTTSYVTHTSTSTTTNSRPVIAQGEGGGGGNMLRGERRDIQLLDVLEKFDNHSNYLTWGWHWSTVRPFYSYIILLSSRSCLVLSGPGWHISHFLVVAGCQD